MSTEDQIAKLLAEEKITPDEPSTAPLRKLELKPSAEALSAASIRAEELRRHNRADITQKQIQIQFSNAQQFAKQYVENISLGGLFVRTDTRPGLGAALPIEFSIPLRDGQHHSFRIDTRVCRQTDTGLGLEFLNLSLEARQQLEEFVQDHLPKGQSPSIKRTSQDRLDKIRERKRAQSAHFRSAIVKLSMASILIGLNVHIGREFVLDETERRALQAAKQEFIAGNKRVQTKNVQGIRKTSSDEVELLLSSGEKVKLHREEITPYNLPPHLFRSIENSISHRPPEKIRRTKNLLKRTK